MTIKNRSKGGMGLLASLCLVMGLASCHVKNARFCETNEDCIGDDFCSGSVCVGASQLADAGPTGSEQNQDNLQSDAAPGEPVCPTDTHQCLTNAPFGWSGPSLRADGDFGDTPPNCPGDFAAEFIGYRELVAEGSCGCSCGEPFGVSCSPGAIEGRDGALGFQTCFATCSGDYCDRQVVAEGTCSSISSAVRSRDNLRLELGQVNGGSCGAGEIENNLAEPRFAAQTALCSLTDSLDGCGQEGVCAPKTPEDFNAQTCIFQEGEHECPADSIYTERLVTYESYDDQRSCDSCDCTFKTQNSTCGEFEFFNDDTTCSGDSFSATACAAMPVLISGRVQYNAVEPDVRCDATPNPETSGDAVAVGATTLCCTAL